MVCCGRLVPSEQGKLVKIDVLPDLDLLSIQEVRSCLLLLAPRTLPPLLLRPAAWSCANRGSNDGRG